MVYRGPLGLGDSEVKMPLKEVEGCLGLGEAGEFLRLTQAEALRLILRIQPRSGAVPEGTHCKGVDP